MDASIRLLFGHGELVHQEALGALQQPPVRKIPLDSLQFSLPISDFPKPPLDDRDV